MVLNGAVDYTQVAGNTSEAGRAKPWLTSRRQNGLAVDRALANFTSKLFCRCGDFAVSAVSAAFSA
jgi:hypothetical protein